MPDEAEGPQASGSPAADRSGGRPGLGRPGHADLRADEGGRPAPAIRHPLPLLESLVGDHLDPGYQAAADARAARAAGSAGPSGSARSSYGSRAAAYLSAGLVIVGLVLGIAAASTNDQAAGADQARVGLLHDIDSAQAKQSRLALEQATLAAQIRSAQASLGAGGPLQTVSALEAIGGLTAVTGPGLTVAIDGSTASSGAGVILDQDIQLLVNGLWSAGAEAISIGGVRLRTTSAIRQAGGAILVDNRPVFWPITIDAVGDPASLHVRLVDTIGFGRFQTFVSLYGIRFDVSAQPTLALPAGGAPAMQYASAGSTTSAPKSTPGSGPAPGSMPADHTGSGHTSGPPPPTSR